MSSKVVHLSDDAHKRAKAYCKANGLKMSDWVAALIETALGGGSSQRQVVSAPPPPPVAAPPQPPPRLEVPPSIAPAPRPAAAVTRPPVARAVPPPAPRPTDNEHVHTFVSKKKVLDRADEAVQGNEEVPPWAAPPFWAQGNK